MKADNLTLAQTLLDPLNPGSLNPEAPEDEASPSKRDKQGKVFLGVVLKEGYSIANFLVIPLTSSTMIYAATFMNVAILFLLKDPDFYAVPESEIGRVTNNIIFYSQLMVAPFILVVGYVYDIIGRRMTIFFTLVPAAVLMMYIPDAAPSINMVIILRLGIVTAVSTLSSHPFINDYVSKETRGRAIALQSIGVVIGDLMTFVLVLNITRGMSPYGRFKFFGFSVIAIACLFLLLVKEPRFKERSALRGFEEFEEKKSFQEKAKELTRKVWDVCKSDIVFPICLFGTMTARTLHYLFGTFLTLYIISEVTDRTEAEVLIQQVNITCVIAAVLIVVPAGRIADNLSAKVLIPIMYFLNAFTLIAFQFIPSPREQLWPLYVVVTLIMIGSVCTMTSIETVFSRNLPKEVRGTMNSIQTLFGTIGGLLFTVVGGYMFDLYGTKSPFLIVAIINLVFAAFVSISGMLGWFKH